MLTIRKKESRGKKASIPLTQGINISQGGLRQFQLFGPTYSPLACRSSITYTLSASPGSSDNWKGNSFYLAGPQINNSGAYGANVPAGLSYLLSSDSASGAAAPYSRANIKGSRITYRILPTSTNTGPGRICIFPSTVATTAGLTYVNACEQPYAVQADVPATQTNRPIVLSNFMTTDKIYGVRPMVQKIPDFRGTATSDPVNLWYWHVVASSSDGTSDLNWFYDVMLEYITEFDQRNQFSSTVPS